MEYELSGVGSSDVFTSWNVVGLIVYYQLMSVMLSPTGVKSRGTKSVCYHAMIVFSVPLCPAEDYRLVCFRNGDIIHSMVDSSYRSQSSDLPFLFEKFDDQIDDFVR